MNTSIMNGSVYIKIYVLPLTRPNLLTGVHPVSFYCHFEKKTLPTDPYFARKFLTKFNANPQKS